MRREDSERTNENASAADGVSSGARREDVAEPHERNGLDPVVITSDDRRGHGQGVQNRFFRRVDGRCDDRIQVRIRKMSQWVRRFRRIMRNDVCRGKGQDKVAAAVPGG
jgi:hypothetical protein